MRTIFRRELTCVEWRGLSAVALGLALVMLVPVTASGADPSPTPGRSDGGEWTGGWKLGGYHGTDSDGRGEVTPSVWGDVLLFADLRGKLFDEDVQAGNFALGYRRLVPTGGNFGTWSGFDRRLTHTNNTFWQVSRDLLYGVDRKIGVRLLGGNVPDNDAIFRPGELWVYSGGFWSNSDGAVSRGTGPEVRAEWRFDSVIEELPGSRLTLGGEFSRDHIRDDEWEFGLRLRIPFGGPVPANSVQPYSQT